MNSYDITDNVRHIGILGGTFNPIHFGHLRIATECREYLLLDEVRMIPCAIPPHRVEPQVSAEHRLAMLQLALADTAHLVADDRELKRPGPSYTIDTLYSLKKDFPQDRFYLIIGSDSFQTLTSWHRWQEYLELSHIIIAQRPEHECDQQSEVGQLLKQNFTSDMNQLKQTNTGLVYMLTVTQLEISATKIRQLISAGKSTQFLLPDSVINYIEKNSLYC